MSSDISAQEAIDMAWQIVILMDFQHKFMSNFLKASKNLTNGVFYDIIYMEGRKGYEF